MRLTIAALLVLAGTAAAQPPGAPPPAPTQQPPPPAGRATTIPFIDVSIGLAAPRETPPELVDPTVGFAGHIGVGIRIGRYATIGVASSLFRASYDNTFEAPNGIEPEDRMTVSRLGGGIAAAGLLPVGIVQLWAGGGVHVFHAEAVAEGVLFPVPGEYASSSDTSLGFELSAGISASPWPCGRGGLRVVSTWYRPTLTREVDLGGLAIELFVQVDLVRAPTQQGGSQTRC